MEKRNINLSELKIDRTEKSYNPDSKKKYYVSGAVLLIIVILLMIIFKGALFNPAVEVKMTTATIQSAAQNNAVLTASGYVVAQRKAAIASKGTGRLVYLGFVEGDQVKKGQIIGRLEDSDIKAQLEQARANLKLNEADLKDAETNYKRQKALLKTNASTEMDLSTAEARYSRVMASIEVAKAGITAAEVALENTLIRAPFDGTILTKNADVGEIVAPLGAGANAKSAVVTIADMTSLQVEADVSESNIEKIQINQDCEIVLDAYPGQGYDAYVAKVVPTADRSKATVMVKVGFKNYDKRVLPEMSAKVTFLSRKIAKEEEKPALVLPSGAVAQRNGKNVVFLVHDDKAIETSVITGRQFGSYIEITSGLSDGDKVIDALSEKIVNNTKVEVK